jgi:hypothetical protein
MQEMVNKAYEVPKTRKLEEYKESEESKKRRIIEKRAKSERKSLKREKYEDEDRRF